MDKEGIKGFIFDYGGTLDTRGCHWGQMLWHAYERNAVPVNEPQFRESYVYAERTLGTNPIIQSRYTFHKTLQIKVRIEMDYLVEKGYLAISKEDFVKMNDAIVDDLYATVKKITSESQKLVKNLSKVFPLVLVSNFYGNISVVLDEFGFNDIFQKVIESAVVGIRKPDPRIFMLGVEALGFQPGEIVVVGDSFGKDILPAKKIGCQTIWFKGETWTPETNDESIPDAVITDINQIKEICE